MLTHAYAYREPNVIFLALEGLSTMACNDIAHDAVQAHQSVVTKLLHVRYDV
jgi:hypothetical protein